MAKQPIITQDAPKPVGPYSQGLRAGDFVFVSGQGPLDPETGKIDGDTIEIQTRRVLDNIKAILTASGAGMEHVVKTTVHLSDMAFFGDFNKVYANYFPDPKPTRTTVGSQLPGILVEIDVVAYLG